MDRLTSLESELLRCVESLVSGSQADAEALKKSLIAYGRETSDAIDTRFATIEERASNIEAQQAYLERLLTGLTERFERLAEELNSCEVSVLSLAEELRKSRPRGISRRRLENAISAWRDNG